MNNFVYLDSNSKEKNLIVYKNGDMSQKRGVKISQYKIINFKQFGEIL